MIQTSVLYSVYGVNDNNFDMWDAAKNAVNFHCKDTATVHGVIMVLTASWC